MNATASFPTFHTGALAYYDSFSGLIPCKVILIQDAAADSPLAGRSSDCRITVKLTARRGAYKRGEAIESDALKIIPRPHIRRERNGMERIRGGYRWRA